jgi:preprotein translocase subunit SecE
MVANVKKAQLKQESSASGGSPFEFLGDVKGEFRKITWTSQDELKAYTKIVVGATFAFGMVIYGTDLLIQTALASLDWMLGGG